MRLNYCNAVVPHTAKCPVFKWNDFYKDFTFIEETDHEPFVSEILSRKLVIDPSLPPLETYPNEVKWSSGYAAYLGGTMEPPASSSVYFEEKVKSLNKDFKRRSRLGEMIIAPYFVRAVTFIKTNGVSQTIEKNLGYNFFPTTDPVYGLQYPIVSQKDLGGSNPNIKMLQIGTDKYINPSYSMNRVVGSVDFIITPGDLGVTDASLEALYGNLIYSPVDPAWVQSFIADSNKRCIDWLTTVAELPETLTFIFNCLRAVGGALKSFRNKELRIRERFRLLGIEIKKQISDCIEMLSRAKSKTLVNKLRRELRRLNRRYSKLGKELTTALANAWMTYRYVIMTNIMTVEDAMDAVKKAKFEYFINRDKTVVPASAPVIGADWEFSGSCDVVCKVMLKYQYAPVSGQFFSDVTRVASANFALTAWELGKRSFVVDWFLSVGDFLSAGFGTPSNSVASAFTLSYKSIVKGTYVHKSTGCKISVDYSAYQRFTPNPNSFLGIYFRKNLNWKRMLDAFAMAWPTLRRQVR